MPIVAPSMPLYESIECIIKPRIALLFGINKLLSSIHRS
jgi:hypothetical protein